MPGFLKLFLCGRLYVCVCMSTPEAINTSGMMWHDMYPIRLIKQVYSCYMATVVVMVNGHGLGIGTCCRH